MRPGASGIVRKKDWVPTLPFWGILLERSATKHTSTRSVASCRSCAEGVRSRCCEPTG